MNRDPLRLRAVTALPNQSLHLVFKDEALWQRFNQQAAIGNIMHRVHLTVLNKPADEFCMRTFLGEINRRRRAVFAAE